MLYFIQFGILLYRKLQKIDNHINVYNGNLIIKEEQLMYLYVSNLI